MDKNGSRCQLQKRKKKRNRREKNNTPQSLGDLWLSWFIPSLLANGIFIIPQMYELRPGVYRLAEIFRLAVMLQRCICNVSVTAVLKIPIFWANKSRIG